MDSKDIFRIMGSYTEGMKCLARAEAIREVIKKLEYEAKMWDIKAARIMDNTADDGGNDCWNDKDKND